MAFLCFILCVGTECNSALSYPRDRVEFLVQKENNKDTVVEEVQQPLKISYIIKPHVKKRGLYNKIFFSVGVVALLVITFLYGKMQRSYEVTSKEIPAVIIKNNQAPLKNLYLPFQCRGNH